MNKSQKYPVVSIDSCLTQLQDAIQIVPGMKTVGKITKMDTDPR